MAKRIGLLTGGGDAPGLNSCLKTIVYDAIDQGYEVVGIRKGWEGLLAYDPADPMTHTNNAMIMSKSRVRAIDRVAGSFLHASRINPSQVKAKDVPPFLSIRRKGKESFDLTDHIKRVIEDLRLEGLIMLGDNAALTYAARLSEEGVPLVGIPKSVHNDISGTSYSLGFSTAVGRGVEFVHELRQTAASREEIAVVSILGRRSGVSAMIISLLASSDRTLIPQVHCDPERLGKLLLDDKRMTPNNYAVLIMSEGATIAPEHLSQYGSDVESMAHITGERSNGALVTHVLQKVTGQRLLHQPLSYLLGTGAPDGWDLLMGTNFGLMAVGLIAEGKTGRMIAFRPKEGPIGVPIQQISQPRHINIEKFYDATTYKPKRTIFRAATGAVSVERQRNF
jgi:6-phosphofructokinase 1